MRAIDRAEIIKFIPNVVSRHNIPDLTLTASASTAEFLLAKLSFQLRLLDKAALFSDRPELRRHAMQHRVYVLERIAQAARVAGHGEVAQYYAREALAKLTMLFLRLFGNGRRRALAVKT